MTKTYVVAALLAAGGIGLVLNGQVEQGLELLGGAAAVAGLRHAVSKLDKKVEPKE